MTDPTKIFCTTEVTPTGHRCASLHRPKEAVTLLPPAGPFHLAGDVDENRTSDRTS